MDKPEAIASWAGAFVGRLRRHPFLLARHVHSF